jgi:hypothetical protein
MECGNVTISSITALLPTSNSHFRFAFSKQEGARRTQRVDGSYVIEFDAVSVSWMEMVMFFRGR